MEGIVGRVASIEPVAQGVFDVVVQLAAATTGFAPGHGSWVTSAGGARVLVSGTEDTYGYYDCWYLDPADAAGTLRSLCGWRDFPSTGVWGDYWAGFVTRTESDFYYENVANPLSGGTASYWPDQLFTGSTFAHSYLQCKRKPVSTPLIRH